MSKDDKGDVVILLIIFSPLLVICIGAMIIGIIEALSKGC